MNAQIPTPEHFLGTPHDPAEDEEQPQLTIGPGQLWQIPPDPLARIAMALEHIAGQWPLSEAFTAELAITDEPHRVTESSQYRALAEECADLDAKLETAYDVINRVAEALGKSKAAPALAAKAVIDAWKKGPAEPVEEQDDHNGLLPPDPDLGNPAVPDSSGDSIPHLDGGSTIYPGAPAQADGSGDTVSVDPSVAQGAPAHDASVTDWRGYARRVHGVPAGEACVFDTMNRSQVRTALGIEQPVNPSQQPEGGA